jgi:hypothetical protein
MPHVSPRRTRRARELQEEADNPRHQKPQKARNNIEYAGRMPAPLGWAYNETR